MTRGMLRRGCAVLALVTALLVIQIGLDPMRLPIGAQGVAAIYTSGEHGAWDALREISISLLVMPGSTGRVGHSMFRGRP
jgi:hypothetical protein